MRVLSLLPLLLVACSGSSSDGDDTDTPDAKAVTLTMVSPEDGAEYAYEDPLALHVEAKREGKAVSIDAATWTIGDWTGDGKETEASGLEPGAHTVSVDVIVGEETYSKSVSITIAEPVQTLFSYSGTLEADVLASVDNVGDFDDHCSTSIRFTVDTGVLSGGGTCVVFADVLDPIPFTLEGTVRGGGVTGELVMVFDGNEARTPFSGDGRSGEPLSVTFDETHRSSDGSVRIVGSWSATAE